MASTAPLVRKKRNFKGLGLTASALAPPPQEPEPLPILGPSLVPQRPAPIPHSLSTVSITATVGSGNSSTPSLSGVSTPSIPAVVTPANGSSGGGGGGKKKRPGPLSLGPKSIGGSAAQESQDKLASAVDGANGSANGKSILDESGMLTIPSGSGSAPVTATMSGASPFR
jgi:hypothetical protein